MWRDQFLAALLLHDSVERPPELQARIDSARPSWVGRRLILAVVGVFTVLGIAAVIPRSLVWPFVLVMGLALSEGEVHAARSAGTVRAFETRVMAFRIALVATLGLAVPLIVGPSWMIPATLVTVMAISATQLSQRRLAVVVAAASASYVAGAVTLDLGQVEPLDPGGLSGSVSMVAAITVAVVLFPLMAMFVFVRSRRAAESRIGMERAIEELKATQQQLQAAQTEDRQLSERLSQEVERKTEELARRNRALSIVNAISFALSEPFRDDTALRRAARLVARLLNVEAVQVRELSVDGVSGAEVLVGAAETESLPSLSADVVDAAIERGEGVIRSTDIDGATGPPYLIVPMVTQGTIRGSLTLFGDECRGWGEQELHLLTLIGREMGAALESARRYRDAVALAERELLVTDVTALLNGGGQLYEQLDALLGQIGSRLGPRFASVIAVDGQRIGPELARWEPEDAPSLTDDAFAALAGELSLEFGTSAVSVVDGRSTDAADADDPEERLGQILVAPVRTTQSRLVAEADAPRESSIEAHPPRPSAVLVVAAQPESAWPAADVELLVRLASAIGRRLEGEQLVQLQQRRFDELEVLADIGRVIQSGSDVDRLYAEFASALHRLVSYQELYVVRMRDSSLSEVLLFSDGGRVREQVALPDDADVHPWFHSRGTITWHRDQVEPPPFINERGDAGLVVPMRPKGQGLGAVVLVGDETHPLSARLAERAVEQLALALDSAELYRQATERASRIEAQRNLANIVASAVDLRGAFDAFAEEVRWLIPFERAVMLSIAESGDTVEQIAIYPPIPDGEFVSARLAGSMIAPVLEGGSALALRRSDPALADLDWSLVGPDAAEVAAVPILDGDDATAIFALVHSGVADYAHFDLRVLEEVAGLLAVTIDRLRLYERAEHAARHDLLTGLPNYRFLQERLATLRTEFSDTHRSSVLVIDMDGLKLYNDTLGHDAGDRAIQRVAEELRHAVRSEDLVARTGGDEFVVVMEDIAEEDALIVADRMHESLRDIHREFGNAPVPVRISVGIAFAPDDGTRASELLEAADRAMYAAKFGGGDRTRVANGDQDAAQNPRTLRRRGNRVMELLIRSAVDGVSGPERLAVALAQRYVVAVAIGLGLPIDTADPLRMLVAGEAAHHIQLPEEHRDQETALMLLDGLRTQWDDQMDAADLQVSELLPAAVRLAWEQIPEPDGPGLSAEQALTIVKTDPAYHLGPEVLELLSQSALTAEFERRRSRRDAA